MRIMQTKAGPVEVDETTIKKLLAIYTQYRNQSSILLAQAYLETGVELPNWRELYELSRERGS